MNIDYNSISLLRKLKIKNVETKFSMRQLIDSDTRITSMTSSLLDWVYTMADYISNPGAIIYNISDHLPFFVTRKKTRKSFKKITITGRSYSGYDKETFQTKLNDCDWTAFDRTD